MMNPNQPRMVGQPMPMTAQQPAPVIPIGPDPAQQQLMRAMMARQMQELSQARTPQEAIGRALPLYAATFRNYQDQQGAKERQEALTKALTGAEDYHSLIGAMISSGDPDYQKAALSQRLAQFAPKAPEAPEKPLRGKDRFITTPQGIFDTVDQMIVPGTEIQGDGAKPIKLGDDTLVQKGPDGNYDVVYQKPSAVNETGLSPIAEQERQKAIGKAQGEATVALPHALQATESLVADIDSLLADPGLPKVTGPLGSYIPNVFADATRAKSRIDQILGKTFLQAFESLKGAGPVTDKEGDEAKRAMNRLLSTDMDDSDYVDAITDFRKQVGKLYGLAQERAGIPPEQRKTISPLKPLKGGDDGDAPVQVSSPEEAMQLPPGTKFITPDGREKVRP